MFEGRYIYMLHVSVEYVRSQERQYNLLLILQQFKYYFSGIIKINAWNKVKFLLLKLSRDLIEADSPRNI